MTGDGLWGIAEEMGNDVPLVATPAPAIVVGVKVPPGGETHIFSSASKLLQSWLREGL